MTMSSVKCSVVEYVVSGVHFYAVSPELSILGHLFVWQSAELKPHKGVNQIEDFILKKCRYCPGSLGVITTRRGAWSVLLSKTRTSDPSKHAARQHFLFSHAYFVLFLSTHSTIDLSSWRKHTPHHPHAFLTRITDLPSRLDRSVSSS